MPESPTAAPTPPVNYRARTFSQGQDVQYHEGEALIPPKGSVKILRSQLLAGIPADQAIIENATVVNATNVNVAHGFQLYIDNTELPKDSTLAGKAIVDKLKNESVTIENRGDRAAFFAFRASVVKK